jgi:hypothetical protein
MYTPLVSDPLVASLNAFNSISNFFRSQEFVVAQASLVKLRVVLLERAAPAGAACQSKKENGSTIQSSSLIRLSVSQMSRGIKGAMEGQNRLVCSVANAGSRPAGLKCISLWKSISSHFHAAVDHLGLVLPDLSPSQLGIIRLAIKGQLVPCARLSRGP